MDDIGLKRPQLSKDLQEVYDTLMNFQKRDSVDDSLMTIPRPVNNPKVEEDHSDRLSDILAAYGADQGSNPPYSELKATKNEYFIPVDYETYQKWLHQNDVKQPDEIVKAQCKIFPNFPSISIFEKNRKKVKF